MGARSLPRIAAALLAGGRRPETPVALIRWGTTDSQVTITGRLDEIAGRAEAVQLAPPVVVVVGDVVALRERLAWFPGESAARSEPDGAGEELEMMDPQLREALLRLR